MNQETPHEVGAELVVGTLSHRFALIAACGLLGASAGWFWGASQPPTFTSSASVLVNPVEGNPYAPSGYSDSLTSLETEAQIVRSDAVLQRAADELGGGRTPAILEDGVEVLVPTNTQILQVSYTSADAEEAQVTTQTLADAYLEHRGDRAADIIDAQVSGVESQIEEVLEDLGEATEASLTGPDEERAFQAEVARALSSELVGLRAERLALRNASPEAGRVISPASLSAGGVDLLLVAAPFGGGLAGLLLGFTLGMAIERKRGLVRSARDVEAVGLRVLAVVPRRRASLRPRQLADLPGFDEAVRRLRAHVLEHKQRPSVIAVAACSPSATDPGMAEALASSLSRSGRQVILVHADRDRHETREESPGLQELLSGDVNDATPLLTDPDHAGVRHLSAGAGPTAGSDVFLRDRLQAVLEPLAADCDVLVVRAPDLQSSQGEALAQVASLVVVLATLGHTRRSEVRSVALRDPVNRPGGVGAILLPRSSTRARRAGTRTTDAASGRPGSVEHPTVGVDSRSQESTASVA